MAAVHTLMQRTDQRLLNQGDRLGRLPILPERLPDPHLGHPLCVDSGHARVQRVGVQLAVHESWEENDSSALLGLDLDIDSPEECRATLRDMIKIHQHSRHALPPICAKRTPRISVRVDAVVMLNVALTVSISRDLGKLHVTERLSRQCLDLLEQDGTRLDFLCKMTGETGAALGCLAPCNGVRLGALQQRGRRRNKLLAFLLRQEVVDKEDWRLLIEDAQAGVF
mmetsp:Transcript_42480/g.95988  ORF Transcript_42480/g.95988 Transcript_42480/m.95988 type:complete len:225 (-) Transcript_42480:161-835(-)